MANCFIPTITKPTRVTIHSPTFIDHAFLKYNPQTTYIAGSITTDISDHNHDFIFFDETSNKPKYTLKRSKRRIVCKSNINSFKHALSTTNWEDLVVACKTECPNEAYTLFVNKCNSLLGEHFPEEIVRLNKYKNNKHPWITNAILKAIHTRDHLSRKRSHSKMFHNIDHKYRHYRNLLNIVIHNAKSQYWNKQFVESKNDMKQTWTNIKHILHLQTKNIYPHHFKTK